MYRNILVAGSTAFDFLFRYDGELKDHFEGQDLKNLSTCFFSPTRERYFGGCGANISFSLSLFGEKPYLISVVGSDFGPEYENRLKKAGVNLKFTKIIESGNTASAYIVSDEGGNQITIFYPGVSLNDHDFSLNMGEFKDSILIIAPMNLKSMVNLAKEALSAGMDYIFDPGQQITLFKSGTMKKIVENSWATILNEYELDLMTKSIGTIVCKRLIVTKGDKGSEIIEDSSHTTIDVVKPKIVHDPTGCGDAYRAGLLYGLKNGFDLKKACRVGALTATYGIEQKGTQNHFFTLQEFSKRYKESFKEEL